MSNNVWKILEPDNQKDVLHLSEALNIPQSLARLLVMRNIRTFDEAKRFFRPDLSYLHDPFLMDGMEAATGRVIHAVTHNEKILVYGDYDVDGTCSTALMYMFLKELGAQVEYYIPNRMKEGYGISTQGIDYAASIGTNLMISVDCGITAIEETDYAKSLGVELIICDHHKPKDILPAAFAVLDPLKPQCDYPFKYLSGAGVAFKLAQGISERVGLHDKPMKYLDLVALAGAADIVPLTDENRILVTAGLQIINKNPRHGVAALIRTSRIPDGYLSSGQIVFSLAPRINAAGRLSDAKIAVELLITNDQATADRLAQDLESENTERRKIDEGTWNEASLQVENSEMLAEQCSIVLHNEQWHPGVIGIVASRMVEKYYKPTIMLTTVDGVAKGSARSVSRFNIYDALRNCEDILLHYGGHEAAAGLAVELDKLEEFKERFNRIVMESISDESKTRTIEIDTELPLSEITPKFIRILEQFAPFGPGNHRPVFKSDNVHIRRGAARFLKSIHFAATLRDKDSERDFDSIGFNMLNDDTKRLTAEGGDISAVFSIDYYTRDGKRFPQLKLKDLAMSGQAVSSNKAG
ncbi:MAG: single-stranded-DNA-specific exonuclease RecJ [Ignavibacteriaceae bacterium]|nr:single-stranded-DNA-specific exonuclease RecJ [Ignavibacteriaceae bacterium]